MKKDLKKGVLLSVTFLAALSMASVGFAEPDPGGGSFSPPRSAPSAPAPRVEAPRPAPAPRAEPVRQAAPAPRVEAPRPAAPAPRVEAPRPVQQAPARPAQQAPVRQAPAAPAPRPVQQTPARPAQQAPARPAQQAPARPSAPVSNRPATPAAPSRPAQTTPSRPSAPTAPSRPAQTTPSRPTTPVKNRPTAPTAPSRPAQTTPNRPTAPVANRPATNRPAQQAPAKQVSGAAAQSAVAGLKKNGNVSRSGVNANIPDASHVKTAHLDAKGNVKSIVTDKGTTLKMSAPNARGQQHVLSSVKTLPNGQMQKVKYDVAGRKSAITRTSKSGEQITVRKNATGHTAFSSTVVRNNQKIKVVSMNSRTSYVSKTVNVRIHNTNITVVRNTYIRGGHVFVSNYRPYGVYRGFHIYGYMPAYYYTPYWYSSYVFNPWGAGPWSPYAGIAWSGWGWGWYNAPYYQANYGWYYHPYTHYYAPSYWVTDYLVAAMVANSLADSVAAANASAADAASSAVAAEDAAAEAQDASQAASAQAGISDDMKNQIANQVSVEIKAQAAAQVDPNAPVQSVQQTLADTKHLYVVSDDSDETLADGSGDDCSLSSGDILTVDGDVDSNSPTVNMKVISSKFSKKNLDECKAGTVITKSVEALQAMENAFNENVDSGMKDLAEKSKTDSTLPKPAQDVTPQSTMSQQDIAAEGKEAQALVSDQAKEAQAVESTTTDDNN